MGAHLRRDRCAGHISQVEQGHALFRLLLVGCVGNRLLINDEFNDVGLTERRWVGPSGNDCVREGCWRGNTPLLPLNIAKTTR